MTTRDKSSSSCPTCSDLLASQEDQIRELEWTLDNVYTLARRELRRPEQLNAGPVSAKERWGHVLRLCEKAGCKPRGVLRDNGGSLND
jgi:hypothetical protein